MAETKNDLPVVAHRIYIAAQQRQEFVQDLDDAVDDLTNCDCEVEALTYHAAAQSRINALLEEVEGLRKDAARYDWIRRNTSGRRDGRRCEFDMPDPHPLSNIMQGSVAQHLDAAIDAAMSSGRSGSGEAVADNSHNQAPLAQ